MKNYIYKNLKTPKLKALTNKTKGNEQASNGMVMICTIPNVRM